MAKKISNSLEFYYDEDLFNKAYTSELDPTSLVLLESGAMVEDGQIANLISTGGNYYTIPFYKDIEGNEVNYDGATNITTDDSESGVWSGVVYGRAKGWESTTFVNDFTTADPMRNILNRIQKWKSKKVQARLIGILEAVFGVVGADEYADWNNHIENIASATSTVTDANKVGLTTFRDVAVKANGDGADDYSLAIMHSQVANRLSQLQVIEYYRANYKGMELDVRVAKSGNMTVLICDEVPHAVNSDTNQMEYTTYLFGNGAIRHASAPVDKPTEFDRDPATNGGVDKLYTRYRETIHPYGFSFGMANLPVSPTDAQLSDKDNWSIVFNPKTIYMAKIVSNG